MTSKTSQPWQRGSAMTEGIILSLIMFPMFFAIPMIGNLLDLKQTTVAASRYAAWESTVTGRDQPASLIGDRFFRNPSAAISSVAQDLDANSLWGEEAQDTSIGPRSRRNDETSGKKMSAEHSDTSISIDHLSVTSHAPVTVNFDDDSNVAFAVGKGISKSGELLGWMKGTEWGLTANGMVKAEITVDVNTNDWLTTQISKCGTGEKVYACIQESNEIMVDGWSSANDRQARRRVRSYVPATALRPIGNMLSNFGVLPPFKELKRLDNAFGHVEMSVLPKDVAGRNLDAYTQ